MRGGLRFHRSGSGEPHARETAGFTLVELMIVIAILATLSSLAVPIYRGARESARETVVIREMTLLQNEIDLYLLFNGSLPETLADLTDFGDLQDPWGNPYVYLNFATIKGKGEKRKDHFLVPLNSTYDLCSMGPDGKTAGPLTAKASRDDIIRANDGEYIGPASRY